MINPALEANKALPLYESALNYGSYNAEQLPLLVSLSSEADLATKYAFPIGQTFGLLATSNQVEIERKHFINTKPDTISQIDEQHLDSGTLGNFSPFLTHRLEVPALNNNCEDEINSSKVKLLKCSDYTSGDSCGPKKFPSGLERIQKGSYFGPKPENFPLYFVRTNKNFMGGHSDIFNPHVIAFLTAQLKERFQDNSANQLFNSLLNKAGSDSFAENYAEQLEFSCELFSK